MNEIESIRLRPGMYIGSTNSVGIEHLIQELVANVIDLFLANKATFIEVKIDENRIEIIDDGPGLPFDEPMNDENSKTKAELLLTTTHYTNSALGHSPHIHLLNGGIGLAPVLALSSKVQVQSWRKGNLWEQIFIKGKSKSKAKIIEKSQKACGSVLRCTPDPEIFGSSKPRIGAIRSILLQAVHLFPGLKITFNKEQFYSPNGLSDLAFIYGKRNASDLRNASEAFNLRIQNEKIKIQVACLGETDKNTQWYSWVNGTKTDSHGTHVAGLKEALTKAKWKPSLALIHVIFLEPEYSGPVRDKLIVTWVRNEVQKNLRAPISDFYQKNLASHKAQ